MFSITAKFKEHSIKFRILVIVLPVVILSYIILLSSFYMIYVKESRNNILLEHEENTLSIAKNTASYFSSLNSNIDLLLYGTEIQSLIHSYADKKLSPEEVQSLDMVGMFMCDQDTVHIFSGKIQGIQAFFDTLPADPHIHQNMCLLRAHINTVAAASAGNTTKSHFSLSLL